MSELFKLELIFWHEAASIARIACEWRFAEGFSSPATYLHVYMDKRSRVSTLINSFPLRAARMHLIFLLGIYAAYNAACRSFLLFHSTQLVHDCCAAITWAPTDIRDWQKSQVIIMPCMYIHIHVWRMYYESSRDLLSRDALRNSIRTIKG